MDSRDSQGGADAQEALIKAKLKEFEDACERFEKAKSGAAADVAQIRLLDELNARRREFYRVLNDAVVDPEHRTGEQYESWKRDRLASARNILTGLPETQIKIRQDRDRLKLGKEKYEFEPAVFSNMQGIIAWESPEEAKLLRLRFIETQLPAGGFDEAIERKPIKQHQSSIAGERYDRQSRFFDLGRLALIIYGVLILLCVAGGLFFKAGSIALLFLLVLVSTAITFGSLIVGVWAIYKGASGATDIDFFGIKVKTKNVAVAFVVIAIVAGLYTTYAVLGSPALTFSNKNLEQGAGDMSPEVSDILEKAKAQYGANDFIGAKESFDRAIALDPHNYILLTNRATVELHLNQKQAALNDIEEATRLHRRLPPQTLRREKAYELVIANTRIQAYASNGKDVKPVLKDVDPAIQDVTDTIMRLYISAGNAALESQLWNDAAANYETAKSFARALQNAELELTCYLNVANSLFNLKGREAESLDQAKKGLELLPAFRLSAERSAYFGGQLLNAKGLSMGAVSNSSLTIKEQEQVFSEGIEKVEKYAALSDSGVDILAALHGNRGDVRLKSGDLEAARTDFIVSMKRYIKRQDARGISRQLVGLAKIASSKNERQLSYAYAVAAARLGVDKPARDRDEDQQLVSSFKALLAEPQSREVEGNLASYLAKETEVEEARWKSLLQ